MLLSGFAPIWALTGVGYLVGRSGLLGPHGERVLGRFVFHVAMPAALFTMVARTPLDRFANASVLAFVAGTAVAMSLGLFLLRLLSRRPGGATTGGEGDGKGAGGGGNDSEGEDGGEDGGARRRTGERAVGTMAAGYVNSANLGIPVAVQVLGDVSFVAPVVLFQILLVTPAVLTVLDSGRGRPALTAVLTLPLRNPILLATGLGAVLSATGWRLPAELARSCELLGGAGVPTALVALGMSLYARPSAEDGGGPGRPSERPAGAAGRFAEVGAVVAVKTVVQPLAAWAFGAYALGLAPAQLLTVVLFSALPTAQNVYTYAREYGVGAALARNAVLCSTLVSMATLSLVGRLPGTS
ncbi:AEC family transporter [Kitasatospora sp. NPDC004240]